MESQDLRNLQEAYLEVYGEAYIDYRKGKLPSGRTPQQAATGKQNILKARAAKARTDNPDGSALGGSEEEVSRRRRQGATTREMDSHTSFGGVINRLLTPGLGNRAGASPRMNRGEPNTERHQRGIDRRRKAQNEEYDLYDIILSHLLDEGYAETQEQAEVIMVNMSEDWRQDIMEKEDSEYEKASDAALDSRYGYGRATGSKTSFERAANRASAAAMLRRLRKDRDEGRTTSRESGADAVHQGWAHTARTSSDQTPEKKERRAKLADTSYSNLPDDEKEKDRVSADAVRAVYNRNKR